MPITEQRRDELNAKHAANTFNRAQRITEAQELVSAARAERDDAADDMLSARARRDDDALERHTARERRARRAEIEEHVAVLVADGMSEHDATTRATRVADGRAKPAGRRAFRGIAPRGGR